MTARKRWGHLALAFRLTLPSALSPATITVGGACTLPDAIAAANTDTAVGGCTSGAGADTVALTADITLTAVDNSNNGLPQISTRVAVDGNGHTVSRDPAAPEFRFFEVLEGAVLELADLTLTAGSASGVPDDGGAILNRGTLALDNTTVTGNESRGSGGGIFTGDYTLATIVSSTISNNATTARYGGGIYADFGSTTIVIDSSITGNYASFDGGGIFAYEGVAVSGSTISGNYTFGRGGGIGMRYTYDSTTVSNSLIAGNTASTGGGFYNGPGSTVSLTNVTLSGNSASGAGGALYEGFYGTTHLVNSTLAGNVPDGLSVEGGTLGGTVHLARTVLGFSDGPNCTGGGALNDEGGNFDDDGSCSGAGVLTGLDPLLADNGGLSLTHALLPGSSAVDASGACGLLTDQRGFGRDDSCDSGAFELDAAPAVTGGVGGLQPQLARCSNVTDGAEATIAGVTTWNCRGAGLPIDTGDRVQQHVRGRPTEPALTGEVQGMGEVRVRCQNFSTGQSLQFPLSGARSFDCRAQGLLFSGGDLLGWTATGNAD